MYSAELALLLARGGSRVTGGAASVKFLTPCHPVATKEFKIRPPLGENFS